MAQWVIGVDPARRADYTGISIMSLDDANLAYAEAVKEALKLPDFIEVSGSKLTHREKEKRLQRAAEKKPDKVGFVLRNVLRLEKHEGGGLDWPVQAEIVARLVDRPELREAVVVTDSLGVGDSFISFLRKDYGVTRVIGVDTTGGDGALKPKDSGGYSIGRNYLIGDLAVALQSGLLRTAHDLNPEMEAVIRRESQNLVYKFTDSGNERVGHHDLSEHDDCVFATGYAWCWLRYTNQGAVSSDVRHAIGRVPGLYDAPSEPPFKVDLNDDLPFNF